MTYTGTTYKKSSISATGKIYSWHLRPLTIEDWITIEAFGKQFQFRTNANADIRGADVLTIDWEDYTVQWTQAFFWISFNMMQCLLLKWT